MPYVYTNPASDAPVFAEDHVFVLSQNSGKSTAGTPRSPPPRRPIAGDDANQGNVDQVPAELVQSMHVEMRARVADLTALVGKLSARVAELEENKR